MRTYFLIEQTRLSLVNIHMHLFKEIYKMYISMVNGHSLSRK